MNREDQERAEFYRLARQRAGQLAELRRIAHLGSVSVTVKHPMFEFYAFISYGNGEYYLAVHDNEDEREQDANVHFTDAQVQSFEDYVVTLSTYPLPVGL